MAQGAEIFARWASLLAENQPEMCKDESNAYTSEATKWRTIANEHCISRISLSFPHEPIEALEDAIVYQDNQREWIGNDHQWQEVYDTQLIG